MARLLGGGLESVYVNACVGGALYHLHMRSNNWQLAYAMHRVVAFCARPTI